MGEVYRARDTRLDRTVAIKVLPPSLANDADRLTRFEGEARVLSTLSHPNLLAIYDVGAQDGLHYLVPNFWKAQRFATASPQARSASAKPPSTRCKCPTASPPRTRRESSTAT